MKEALEVGKRPYVVVEGAVNNKHLVSIINNTENRNEGNKTIVYTGTLNKKFGVVNLVKALF